MNAPIWGGVRCVAPYITISNNLLRGDSKASLFAPVPGSIYCVAVADTGDAADRCVIRGNRLDGPQTGIMISRIDAARVENNIIDGAGTGWYGVIADACFDARICGNNIEEVFFAIHLSNGLGNQVCENSIRLTGMGISSMSENHLAVSNNQMAACLTAGIILLVEDSAKLIENRVYNCGFGGIFSLGIAAFAEQIFIYDESMLRIEGCEVVDTGINPFDNTGTDQRAISMTAVCPTCHITNNRTGYTQDILNIENEHRALFLVGPLGFRYNVGDIALELMFGSAVVSDNHFRGPGHSYLVEFFPWNINDYFRLRFEKVTFNNNICEHLHAEASEEGATVRLTGRNLIAMSNQIKANYNVNAMSLGYRDRVALMGNITTGGYIQVGTVTPAPLTDYNVRT
jgi:hypothetical protein